MKPAEAARILQTGPASGLTATPGYDAAASLVEFECRADIARERREAAEHQQRIAAAFPPRSTP